MTVLSLAELPDHPAGWDALANRHPGLPFRQAWRESPEPGLQSGAARVFLRGSELVCLVTLEDRLVVQRAERNNQLLFALGDVAEVFVQPVGAEAYWEFHADPAGFTYQARFPSLAEFAARRGNFPLETLLAPYLLADPPARVSAWTHARGWSALFRIPLVTLGNPASIKLSFARYDAGEPGTAPLLSCTAPLARRDFHRPPDWPVFHLR